MASFTAVAALPWTVDPSVAKLAEPYCNATETFALFRGCEPDALADGRSAIW